MIAHVGFSHLLAAIDVTQFAQQATEHLVLAVLVLTRLGMMLMAMPAVGVGVPRRVRALLASLITLMLVPVVTDSANDLPQFDSTILMAIAMAREAVVGMLIGATVQLVITGFQTGGEIMSGTGGMQLGDAVDPTTSSSMPTTARLIGLLVTAIFLSVGGHRWMIGALVQSFEALPAGQVVLHGSLLETIVTQLAGGMSAGVRIAAPVVAALLLSNLVTGLISRTLPQINVLAVGLPINALTLLLVMALSIGSIGVIFQSELAIALERLTELFDTAVAVGGAAGGVADLADPLVVPGGG